MSNNYYMLNRLIVFNQYIKRFSILQHRFWRYFQIKLKKFFGKIFVIQNIYIY